MAEQNGFNELCSTVNSGLEAIVVMALIAGGLFVAFWVGILVYGICVITPRGKARLAAEHAAQVQFQQEQQQRDEESQHMAHGCGGHEGDIKGQSECEQAYAIRVAKADAQRAVDAARQRGLAEAQRAVDVEAQRRMLTEIVPKSDLWYVNVAPDNRQSLQDETWTVFCVSDGQQVGETVNSSPWGVRAFRTGDSDWLSPDSQRYDTVEHARVAMAHFVLTIGKVCQREKEHREQLARDAEQTRQEQLAVKRMHEEYDAKLRKRAEEDNATALQYHALSESTRRCALDRLSVWEKTHPIQSSDERTELLKNFALTCN